MTNIHDLLLMMFYVFFCSVVSDNVMEHDLFFDTITDRVDGISYV
jgi:hypothetical protein